MEINQEIFEILKEFKIDKDEGLLCLLGIYHKLDIDKVCSEETIKGVNLTKIVDRDYSNNLIKWNIPLFTGQETEWDWVKTGYNEMWNRKRDRKAANSDVVKRMQEWFKKYPEYRKDDVKNATLAYHKETRDPQFLKNSAAFIFEGAGGSKRSMLLQWCERGKDGRSVSNMKGRIVT